MTANAPPSHLPAPAVTAELPAHLENLAKTARNYARGAKAAATLRAYAADWRHYTAWCQRQDLDPLPPDPQVIGLYLAACASEKSIPSASTKPASVRTIERRLSAITWHCAQRGEPLDRADRHIVEVMKGIRRQHGKPPNQKEAVLAEDLTTSQARDPRGADRQRLQSRSRHRQHPRDELVGTRAQLVAHRERASADRFWTQPRRTDDCWEYRWSPWTLGHSMKGHSIFLPLLNPEWVDFVH